MELKPILQETGETLGQAGFAPQTVEAQFLAREGKADLRLQSYHWLGPAGTDARCAHLSGPRSEILNLMIYPRRALDVPIFAVEIILFGQQPRVAVVDLQPACGVGQPTALLDRLQESLRPLHDLYAGRLTHGGELPDWAIHHFTPWAVYSRPASMEELPVVVEAFSAYLQAWRQTFLALEDGRENGQAFLDDYRRHHVVHTPGRKFLVTSFGAEWTEGYLEQFMYGGGGRPPSRLPPGVGDPSTYGGGGRPPSGVGDQITYPSAALLPG